MGVLLLSEEGLELPVPFLRLGRNSRLVTALAVVRLRAALDAHVAAATLAVERLLVRAQDRKIVLAARRRALLDGAVVLLPVVVQELLILLTGLSGHDRLDVLGVGPYTAAWHGAL